MSKDIADVYKILNEIENESGITQRQLSSKLGYSLGKVNYLLKGLAEKGHVKLVNFKNNKNKIAYMYILTPSGIIEKIHITREYLKRRELEFEEIKAEIEELRGKIDRISPPAP